MLPLENRLRILIKFIDEKYLDDFFYNGHLYMNTLKYFRDYEDKSEHLRGDRYEGLEASYSPSEIKLEVNGRILTELVGKVDIYSNAYDDVKLYCMTGVTDKDIIDAGEKGVLLSNRFKYFGDKAVMFTGRNTNIFSNKINKAVKKCKISEIDYGKVNYLLRDEHHEKMDIFNKFDEYSWQYEWRLALRNNAGCEPFSLYLGDLSKIAWVVDTNDLIRDPIKFTHNLKPRL